MVIMDNNTLKPISGEKYRHQNGIKAIKDGIKISVEYSDEKSLKKPAWFKVPIPSGENFISLKNRVQKLNLSSVCEESKCPNIAECWNHKTATLMVMGNVCTRACKFCAVDTGNPKRKLDIREPHKVATSISLMNIKYAVLTSVNRDDLTDGGADHYAKTVKAIKEMTPEVTVEALAPDFLGQTNSIELMLDSGLEVFAQNLETVDRLTSEVRDSRAGYRQTLEVLSYSKQYKPSVITKTSLMLGLGETHDEVYKTMKDIRSQDVDILTLGQYMRPTINHLPVKKWYTPEEFYFLKEKAISLGFLDVASGPLVRSSYRADRIASLIK